MSFKKRTAAGWATSRSARIALLRVPLLLALLSFTAACTAHGSSPLAGSSAGPTVAFELVDGPPRQVFDRLVKALEAESTARSITIVSREAPASYRVRSYLSAQVQRGKSTIVWVWDIYDRDQQRTLRLTGEEPGGKAGSNAWAAADDEQLMRRIAQAGLMGVGNLINGTTPLQDQPSSEPAVQSGPAIAAADEDGPTRPASQTLAFNVH